ncbi:hypothetical protein KFL_001630160 [Klebsormidium nitens]|uniref:Uncharacterized protein n=1 Tax=Klebsormidium nitens TaxID=105231 RepID=A0A1Y1I329_KLENI|nr:hypothetical protein KFL_001630160 [Klebsormidium nitens]|eukprot:GAQ83819.1 hypothetical protein KFL_001630160 [Klebsormidium nitens]
MATAGDADLAVFLSKEGLIIEERTGRGRCLVAGRTFLPGELILTQAPYAHVLDEANQGNRCDACFVVGGEGLRRCGGCKLVMYCDQKCQRSTWPLHQHECRAISALRRLHGTVPTPTLRLAFRVMAMRTLQATGVRPRNAVDDYARVEALVSHLEDTPRDTLLLYAQMATLVKAMGDVEGSKVAVDPREVTELLGRFACNAHTICDEELKPVGMGLFVVNSLANHDCNPNAIILYDGPRAMMRALRPITAGDEITHAYIDLAGSRNQRRERLRKYYFECQCDRCVHHREDPVDSKVAGLKCADESCGGSPGWDWELGKAARDKTGRYVCKCGRAVPANEADARKEEANRILREEEASEGKGEFQEARRLLEKAHGLQTSVLHRLNWELVRTSDALLRVCMALQDWPAAASWCERTLPAYEACLPQPSALYGLQLFTLAKLKWFLEDAQSCFEAVRRACEILTITHGEKHRLVLEAKDLLSQAQAEAGQRRLR